MPGDVVGVRGGKISKDLTGAEQILVISTNPALVGNAADAESTGRDGYEVTAFLGQVPVRVRGVVQSGDFLLPSGRHDGTAVAVAPRDLRAEQLARVLGRAWESSDEPGAKTVNAAIGLDEAAAAACVIASPIAEGLRTRSLRAKARRVRADHPGSGRSVAIPQRSSILGERSHRRSHAWTPRLPLRNADSSSTRCCS